MFERATVFDKTELFERFFKVVFRFSGFDRFSVFERVLQFDTESAEILGVDTFLPVDSLTIFNASPPVDKKEKIRTTGLQ